MDGDYNEEDEEDEEDEFQFDIKNMKDKRVRKSHI